MTFCIALSEGARRIATNAAGQVGKPRETSAI
jgi:hypothetical protein